MLAGADLRGRGSQAGRSEEVEGVPAPAPVQPGRVMTQGQCDARRKAQEEADTTVPPAKGQDIYPGGVMAEENGPGT